MTVMGSNRPRIAGALVLACLAVTAAACGSGTSDPAGASAKAAGQTKGLPEVIDCSFDKPAVRPVNLILACADLGAEVDKITWKSWAADKAEGDGTERDNTCAVFTRPADSASSVGLPSPPRAIHVTPGRIYTRIFATLM